MGDAGERKSAPSGIKVERYLGYLDKEMTIMGILSAFCVAVLAASLKLAGQQQADLVRSMLQTAPVSFALAHVMLLLAALSFYRQRSYLAWHYGQIALQDSGYQTGMSVEERVADADGWYTWMNYQRGFWFLGGTAAELILAGSLAFHQAPCTPACSRSPVDLWCGWVLVAVLVPVLWVHGRVLKKWNDSEDAWAEFRNHPSAIFGSIE